MTGKEMIKIFKKHGWKVNNIKGSHYNMIHKNFIGKVTIPHHTIQLGKGLEISLLKILMEVK